MVLVGTSRSRRSPHLQMKNIVKRRQGIHFLFFLLFFEGGGISFLELLMLIIVRKPIPEKPSPRP